MPAFDNMAVAARLELAAALLEISGADKFRFLSYRKAASAIRAWPEQVASMSRDGRLTDIPGVGDKMAGNIAQIVERGSFDALDALAVKLPPTLAEVMRVPGVGPKRAALLHEKLGISTIDELAEALADGRVARLGGFGVKTAEKVARSLDAHRRLTERTPLAVALPIAEAVLREVAGIPGVISSSDAGSVRRREETVGDIDLVAASNDPAGVLDAFEQIPAVESVVLRSAEQTIVELHDGMHVTLTVVTPSRFGTALQRQTGSIGHNLALEVRSEALHNDALPDASTEDEVYERLGMDTPPPELRWGADEIELASARRLPKLVELADIRGDLQSHSTFTDGRNTLAANRDTATELGYEYLAATDHAYELRMVGGLDKSDIERQWAEIDALNEMPGARIIKGIELNIADDGSLDYDDELLSRFEIVLASLHSGWDLDTATVTARLVKAIEHPLVDIIAHPTGRILGRREPMRLDMDTVFAAAGQTGTLLEINSYPDRLDLSAEHLRLARRYGVRFSLGTDAHATEHFRYMPYGVAQARRGMVTPEELINAHPWSVARTWLKRSRG